MPYSLIHYAHEKGLKRGKKSVFGNINGQIITLTPSADATILITIHLHDPSSITTERLRSFDSFKKSSAQPHDVVEDVCRFGITHKSFEKKQIKVLQDGIDDIIKVVESFNKPTYQKDLILIGGVARPNSEEEIEKYKAKNTEKFNRKVDYMSAGIVTLLSSIIGGYLFGYGMAMIFSKLKAGLHMISRAFFYYMIPGGIYLKRAKKIDRNGRIIVTLCALVMLVVAEFMLIYYGTNSKGYGYSFNEAMDLFINLLSNKGQYQREFIIGLVIVLGLNFLPARLQFNKDIRIEEGIDVDDEYYNRATELKSANKWRTGILVSSIFIGMFGFVRHVTLGADFDYVYPIHQWGWFFGSWLLSFIFVALLVQLVPMLRKSVGSNDYKPIKKSIKTLEILVYSASIATWILSGVNYVNLEFPSKEITQEGLVTKLDYNYKTKEYFLEFKSDKYPNVFMNAHTKKQPYLIDNTKARATIKEGYLGSPLITEMSYFEVNTFESASKHFKSENELRSSNIEAFVKFDKSDAFLVQIDKWATQCKEKKDYSCRLSSYVYAHKKDTLNQARFVKMGCLEADDPISCYGYFFGGKFDDTSKKTALERLEKGCDLYKADHCLYWAYSLRKVDHPKYHRKIKELIKKGAELKRLK